MKSIALPQDRWKPAVSNKHWLRSCRRVTLPLAVFTLFQFVLSDAFPRVKGSEQQPDSPQDHPELVLQIGHTGKINALAFSPDGKTLATGGDDKTVKLWDTKTGELKRTLIGHGRKVDTIVFSRNGDTLASNGGDGVSCGTGDGSLGETILWDTRTWVAKRRLPNVYYKSFSIGFSPNMRTVVFAPDLADARIYDGVTGRVRRRVQGVRGVVAISPDGHTFTSTSPEGTVQLRDTRTGKVRNTLKGFDPNATVVAFLPDGKLATTGGDGLVLWNPETGEKSGAVKVDSALIAFSHDGRSLASLSKSNHAMTLWNTLTWQLKKTLSLPNLEIAKIAVSPDAGTLAICCADETVKLCNIQTGAMRTLIRADHSLKPSHLVEGFSGKPIVLSPDGLAVAIGSGNTLSVWNTRTGELKLNLPHQGIVVSVAFSADGKMIAAGTGDQTLRLWDATTGRTKQTLTGLTIKSIGFLPDDRTVVAANESGPSGGELLWWDTQTGRRKSSPIEHFLKNFTFSPDGKVITTWEDEQDQLVLMDALTGKTRKTIKLGGQLFDYVVNMAISPDGKTLAVTEGCALVTLRSLQTGAVLKRLQLMNHGEDVFFSAFSPDGKTGATGCGDNDVRLWDSHTGKVKATLKGHSHDVNWVAFFPDGKRLASGSLDGSLKIWQFDGSRLLATFMILPSIKQSGAPLDWIAFTPEGYYTCSPEAARFIRWRAGGSLFPAEKYETTYHRPDLVEKALRGKQ